MIRYQERQLKRLLFVQSRVTETRVIRRQVILIQALTSTQALRHRFTSQLQVHTTQVTALLLVDAQRLLQLAVDVVEASRLDARGGGEGVAVHGVALPDDAAAVLGVLDGADVLREEVADLGGAVARDEGDFAGLARGVEGAEEGEQVRGRGAGADLDADGVGDAAEELDVGVVDLARAVADPDEVRRGVVVLLGRLGGGRGGAAGS